MTISSTTRKAGPFLGNDVTTSFAFEFKVFEESDLEVILNSDEGTETTLALDSDYSVSLNADQDANPGGTITYPISGDPLPEGYTLTVIGVLAELQETDIQNGGGFFPSIIEDRLDYITILIQQHSEKLARAVLAAASDDDPVLSLGTATSRANKIPVFDANGNLELAAAIDNAQALTRSIVGALLYPRTAAEIAAGVTPTDYSYPSGDVPRYNFELDGVTNDYVEFNKVSSVGVPIYLRGRSIRLSGSFAQDDVEIIGPGTIYTDLFKITGDRWKVKGVKFLIDNDATISAANGATSNGLGGVCLAGDDNVLEDCEITRDGVPSAYTSAQIYNVVLGIDFDIGEFISQAHAPSGHGNQLIRCRVHNSVRGVYLGGKRPQAINCDIYNVACGVQLGASARSFKVRWNKIFDMVGTGGSGQDGILGSRNCMYGTISGNYINGATEHGMYFQGSRTSITNNVVRNCSLSGIKVAGHGTFLYWYSDENGGDGPDMEHPLGSTTYMCHDLVISHNTLEGNSAGGNTNGDIYIQANEQSGIRNIIVQANTCRDSSGYAIRTAFADGDDDSYIYSISILDNNCRRHGQANSIWVGGHEDIRIQGNDIDGNITTDAVSTDSGDLTQRLIVRGNKANTIAVFRAAAGWLVEGNILNAISAASSGLGDVIGNTFVDYGAGTANINISAIRDFCGNRGTVTSMRGSDSGTLRNVRDNDIEFTVSSGFCIGPSSTTTQSLGDNVKFRSNRWSAPNSAEILGCGTGQDRIEVMGDSFYPSASATSTSNVVATYSQKGRFIGNMLERGRIAVISGANDNLVALNQTEGAVSDGGSGTTLADNVTVTP